MGKRLRAQRRGRGTPTFRAATLRRVAPARYPAFTALGREGMRGRVERILHDPGRGTPLALIRCEDGRAFYNIAGEGVYEGKEIRIGGEASLEVGNIVPLAHIPEGSTVYNVEKQPADGGKFARSSGSHATVIAHTPTGTTIRLASGKVTTVHSSSLATVGVAAAGGRTEKPFMKTGEKYHLMRARGRKYPLTKSNRMIAAVRRMPGSIARTAPPGQKVGLIAPKKTGRGRKARVKFA